MNLSFQSIQHVLRLRVATILTCWLVSFRFCSCNNVTVRQHWQTADPSLNISRESSVSHSSFCKCQVASISLVVYSCLVYLSTSSTGTSSSMFGCGSAKRLGTSTKAIQRALMKRVVNGSASWETLGSWHESMLRVLPPVCIHFTAQCHDVPSCLYWQEP